MSKMNVHYCSDLHFELGALEEIPFIDQQGADVNAKDNKGKTALMTAAGNGHAEIAEYPHSKGAK